MITHSEVFAKASRMKDVEYEVKFLHHARNQLSQMMVEAGTYYTDEYREFDKFLRERIEKIEVTENDNRFEFYQAIYDAEKELEEEE